MKKSNLYFGKRNFIPGFLLLVLFSITLTLLSSCSKEDDIPPMSSYVPPEIDTTGACVFLTVLPKLSAEEAIEFECEGPEYIVFGELSGTNVIEYTDNPVTDGINPSDRVVSVTQTPELEPWTGFFFDLSEKVDFSSNQGVIIKVYSPAAGQLINLKMEDSADPAIAKEVSVETTVANEWEELCFPFASGDSDKFDRFVLFFNFLGDKDAVTVHYFDDIILGDECEVVIVEPADEPDMAAPVPTLPDAEVISVFSDNYTNIAGTDLNPDWGQATVTTEVDIAGNNTLKYENLNYQGIVLGNAIDVSEMDFLHIDFWTGNATAFNGFLISSGPAETAHAFEITTEQWVSVDIPLSEFSSVVNLMDVIQMKFDGDGTIYIDNIYFRKAAAQPTMAAPSPTASEGNVISIFSDAYTNIADTDFNPDWGQATVTTQVDIGGNNTLLYEDLNYQGTMFAASVDVSEMDFLHVDYWTANSNGFNGFLISPGPAETAHAFAVTTGEWVSVNIPLSEFSSVVDLTDLIQMKFDGDGTIYLDNIYFFQEQATAPSSGAPDPTVAAADVISIFSDIYMNVADTDFNPDWGQATVTSQIDIAGNNTLVYEALNYQGTMFSSAIDVSGKSFLHVDYWTADSNGFNGFLISPGPAEIAHAFAVTTGEWISVDIPLSEFSSAVDLTDVIQMKFDGDGTIYLDNIYFY